jgi:hypothetical protein
VLPVRFVRIRYFGFLAVRVRRKSVILIRGLLGDDTVPAEQESIPAGWMEMMILLTGTDPLVSKVCGTGRMQDVTPFTGVEQVGYG